MKSFKTRGFWWLPQAPDGRLAGTLRYGAAEGLRLSLIGAFGDWSGVLAANDYPIIHGVVKDSPFGKKITLVDCHSARLAFGMPGVSTEDILANRAFIGERLLVEQDLAFDGVSASWETLSRWMNVSGIGRPRFAGKDAPAGVSIEYRRPPEAVLSGEEPRISVRFGFGTRGALEGRTAVVREEVSFRVEGFSKVSFDELNRLYLAPAAHFFALACDEPSSPRWVLLRNSDLRQSRPDAPSPIYFVASPILMQKRRQIARGRDPLFQYSDVKDVAGEVFRAWLDFSRRFEAFCTMYFASQSAPAMYVEDRFLSLLHSISLYVQQVSAPDPAFEDLAGDVDRRLSAIRSGRRLDWARAMLPRAEELALPQTLLALLERHRAVMQPLVGDDMERFLDAVLLARRYYTYCEPALRQRSPQGAELLWNTEKLATLLKACILEQIGLPQELITGLFRRNPTYLYLQTVV